VKGKCKFFRHICGISSFAEVSILSKPTDNFALEWEDSARPYEKIYGDIIYGAVCAALSLYLSSGGKTHTFTVAEVVELPVDTKNDAVYCAAFAATRESLGYSPESSSFLHCGKWIPLVKQS
jgi:hypothetical protein